MLCQPLSEPLQKDVKAHLKRLTKSLPQLEAAAAALRRINLYLLSSTSGRSGDAGGDSEMVGPDTPLRLLLDPQSYPCVWAHTVGSASVVSCMATLLTKCWGCFPILVARWQYEQLKAEEVIPACLTAAHALDTYVWYAVEAQDLRARMKEVEQQAALRRKEAQENTAVRARESARQQARAVREHGPSHGQDENLDERNEKRKSRRRRQKRARLT